MSVHARGTDAIPLAPRPDLAQYRTQAKELLAAARTGDPAAVRAWAHDFLAHLAELQRRSASSERFFLERHLSEATPEEIARRVAQEADRTRDAAVRHRLVGERTAPPTLARAQAFVAWMHGFDRWSGFADHVEQRAQATSAIGQFERAADAVVSGDMDTLDALLRANRSLLRARSSRDHHGTLLHYTAANGHEGFRQKTPANAPAIARLLLERGAEADALADMYGARCTTMEMLVSSVHPHKAGVQPALAELLVEFGAAPNGVDDDGSPLMTALAFGYPDTAATLVRCGARVDHVITAAAFGEVARVEAMLDEGGRLRDGVPLARVKWPKLPPEPAVHVGYALAWASALGRTETVRAMLAKGVDANGRDGDGTALHSACAWGRTEIIDLLLAHGADVEARNPYGGTVLDGTLWWAYNQPIRGVDYAAVVRRLLSAGARDDLYPEMRAYVDSVLSGERQWS